MRSLDPEEEAQIPSGAVNFGGMPIVAIDDRLLPPGVLGFVVGRGLTGSTVLVGDMDAFRFHLWVKGQRALASAWLRDLVSEVEGRLFG